MVEVIDSFEAREGLKRGLFLSRWATRDGQELYRQLELGLISQEDWNEGTYPARPRHVRDAQHAVESFLSGCAVGDETLLICSELTANSVLHSRSRDDGKFILRVTVHAEYIWIECEDAGGAWLARPGDGRPHGLDVVHALCGQDGWGVADLDGGRTGRVVWARLELDRTGT